MRKYTVQFSVLAILAAIVLAQASISSVAEASLDYDHKVYLPLISVNKASETVPTPTPTPVPAPQPDFSHDQQHTLGLHNNARAQDNTASLSLDAKLSGVAQLHAQDMADNNYFSHDSQDGSNPFDRMRDGGVTFGYAAENIGKAWIGNGDTLPAIDTLFNSMMAETPPEDGHRRNILNYRFHKLGVGCAVKDGYLYWVCDFTD